MAENNCLCQEAGVLIFPCSGGSDVGELSDCVGRKIAQCGQARMFCLAGIGAHLSGMVQSAAAAQRIIAIDGCSASCAKRTLEHVGLKVEAYNLKDMGFEKGKTKVNEDSIAKASFQITGGKSEKSISRTPDRCCGN